MYGSLLYNQFNDKKEAITYLKKGVSANKAPKKIRQLASVFLNEKEYKRSEALLKFNIGNEPYRLQPRVDLAKFYLFQKNSIEAKKWIQSIIDTPIKVPSKKANDIKKWAVETYKKM